MMKNGSLGEITWNKFKRNPLGIIPMFFIVIVAVLSILAYTFIPDKVEHANRVRLPLALHPPGAEVKVIEIPLSAYQENQNWEWLQGAKPRFRQIPVHDYKILDEETLELRPYTGLDGEPGLPLRFSKEDLGLRNNEGFEDRVKHLKFYLGTDKLGRDYFSRLLLGARISLSVGFIAVFISILVGVILGSVAGYFGGKIDQGVMWFINVFWSVPTLLWVIAITLALGKGTFQVYLAVGLSMWVDIARMVRGQIMQVRGLEFARAGQTLGFNDSRILFKHILPNSLSPVIVIAASNFATAILLEAGLSFLGIGAQPPIPSWGNMIKDHYAYIIMDKAYLAILPGLAIMVFVLAFMLIGNALRDALDVKL